MMAVFTWDYQGVIYLMTSLNYSAIIATSLVISLMNAQIRICQLPVANVLNGAKQRYDSLGPMNSPDQVIVYSEHVNLREQVELLIT